MSRIRVYDIILIVEGSEKRLSVGQADLLISEIRSIEPGSRGEAKTIIMKEGSADYELV